MLQTDYCGAVEEHDCSRQITVERSKSIDCFRQIAVERSESIDCYRQIALERSESIDCSRQIAVERSESIDCIPLSGVWGCMGGHICGGVVRGEPGA